MWVPPEIKDPVLLHAPTRKSVACFGAVSLSSGTFVRSLCATFNAVTFETFLKTLLRCNDLSRSGPHGLVLVVRKSWLHSWLRSGDPPSIHSSGRSGSRMWSGGSRWERR